MFISYQIKSPGNSSRKNSVAWVRKQSTDQRPPFVGEVSANFCG
jgi:hypothetical protein